MNKPILKQPNTYIIIMWLRVTGETKLLRLKFYHERDALDVI